MPAGAAAPAAARDSLVDVLLEFLEALVHQVLFVRELYAPELFERQRLYGIAVRRSRHPDLNAYIADAVAGLRVGAGCAAECPWAWVDACSSGEVIARSATAATAVALVANSMSVITHTPRTCICCRARSPPARWPRLRCWC